MTDTLKQKYFSNKPENPFQSVTSQINQFEPSLAISCGIYLVHTVSSWFKSVLVGPGLYGSVRVGLSQFEKFWMGLSRFETLHCFKTLKFMLVCSVDQVFICDVF